MGFTLIELLLAGFVLVVVLGAAAAFFSQQARLQRSVQARNELQDRVRMVMHVVAQDLSLAGNAAVALADGTIITAFPGCFSGDDFGEFDDPDGEMEGMSCVAIGTTGDPDSRLRVRYMSSSQLDLANVARACRDVSYFVEDGILIRADVQCGMPVSSADEVALAPGVEAFRVVAVCTGGNRLDVFPQPSQCEAARTALLSFAASSIAVVGGTGTGLSVVAVDGVESVDCPLGRLCFAATQEVLMPNLVLPPNVNVR